MTVAMRQDAEDEILLQKQEEELKQKKLSKNRRASAYTSMLTENELQMHQSSYSRPSSPENQHLFPGAKGTNEMKDEKLKQLSTRKLKKLIKVLTSKSLFNNFLEK